MNTIEELEFLKKLGARIKRLRNERNVSLNELAQQHGFEKASLSRLESGKTNATIVTLLRLSIALNVSVEDFFIG